MDRPDVDDLRARAGRWLPVGSSRRRMATFGWQTAQDLATLAPAFRDRATRTAIGLGLEWTYARWLRHNVADDVTLEGLRAEAAEHPSRCTPRIVVAGQDTQLRELTLASLSAQTWTRWEVIELGSLEAMTVEHPADPVLFCAAGDVLEPDALSRIVDAFWTDPLFDVVTFDDDVIERGEPADPRFRPSWSPDMLLSGNYIGRSAAIRLGALGGTGLPRRVDSEELWRVWLGLAPQPERAGRICRVLAHRIGRDPEVTPRATELVDAELVRRSWPARARRDGAAVQIDWELPEWPTVSIVVPSPHNTALLDPLLESFVATEYPNLEVVIVDNSGRDDTKQAWYDRWAERLALKVVWSDPGEFNYSAANNAGVAAGSGEVLVFCNDDCRCDDPLWLRQLVGWATRSEIGTVGGQLLGADGTIQHGGVIMGINGLAEHLFQGMAPHSPSMLGETDWIRNVTAVTGACVAIRRPLFEDIGGFDEALRLIGNDVVVSLEARRRGLRTVVTAAHPIHHLESATRGAYRIDDDAFRCWWRYQHLVTGGDPYWSPNLSMTSNEPRLASPLDPGSLDLLSEHLGRGLRSAARQEVREEDSRRLAERCRADDALVSAVRQLHSDNSGPIEVRSVNWFLPDFDSPFYGGVNTALRIAAVLATEHGVTNRFVLIGPRNERFFRTAIESAFPDLAPAEVLFATGADDETLRALPPADAAIATIWHSAYAVAHASDVTRKCYLVQDFEPCFHPAGTQYALAEESYRLGLLGICNTPTMKTMYQRDYGGTAVSFTPAVDTSVFHATGRPERRRGDPLTVFLYGRPGHWRNCWELARPALAELKRRHGEAVRIVTAGSWANAGELGGGISHMGLVDYAATGALYRSADIGMALTVSRHPSYLPLELMACGVATVAFDLGSADDWLFQPGENVLLARQTVDGLVERLDALATDDELRNRIAAGGITTVRERHSSWDSALGGIHAALCGPLG